jgi:hypothetical protein
MSARQWMEWKCDRAGCGKTVQFDIASEGEDTDRLLDGWYLMPGPHDRGFSTSRVMCPDCTKEVLQFINTPRKEK